jgi:hypothetical protein
LPNPFQKEDTVEKKDAVSKAYEQYMLDDRLDTFEDEEAFGEAVYARIIDPIEDFLIEVGLQQADLDGFRELLGI